MMRRVIVTSVVCLVTLILGEVALRLNLFRHVSYSNSESIDRQIIDRDVNSAWNILFIGDSETRWGIDPREIDSTFRAHGIEVESFNHAFDGFGASWWPRLLPSLLEELALRNVEVVVLGVQLIDAHRMIRASGEDCGALQKPVLSSPYAKDLSVDGLCRSNEDWDSQLAKRIFHGLWIVRYSSAVRSLIMPSFMSARSDEQLRFNSRKSGDPVNGFVPHRSIAQDRENFDQEFTQWKAQYVPERDFVSLTHNVWPELTSSSGFFDQLNEVVRTSGRTLALFALPTNPLLIDTFNRRKDYSRNSRLLQEWAKDRGVVFIDSGIQEVADHDIYFSDMRHLSGVGAKQYSRKLGDRLATAGVLNIRKQSR